MIGGVVGAGVGIAHDHDAGGDEASGVRPPCGGAPAACGRGRCPWCGRAPAPAPRSTSTGGFGCAERAADEFADAVEVDAEGRLAVRLAGQQVADHRHVVAVDLAEEQRRPAVELLHDRRDLEMRIDRRRIGREPPAARPCGRAPSGSGCRGRRNLTCRCLHCGEGSVIQERSCKLTRSVTMAKASVPPHSCPDCRSSPQPAARSDANFGIKGTPAFVILVRFWI